MVFSEKPSDLSAVTVISTFLRVWEAPILLIIWVCGVGIRYFFYHASFLAQNSSLIIEGVKPIAFLNWNLRNTQ